MKGRCSPAASRFPGVWIRERERKEDSCLDARQSAARVGNEGLIIRSRTRKPTSLRDTMISEIPQFPRCVLKIQDQQQQQQPPSLVTSNQGLNSLQQYQLQQQQSQQQLTFRQQGSRVQPQQPVSGSMTSSGASKVSPAFLPGSSTPSSASRGDPRTHPSLPVTRSAGVLVLPATALLVRQRLESATHAPSSPAAAAAVVPRAFWNAISTTGHRLASSASTSTSSTDAALE